MRLADYIEEHKPGEAPPLGGLVGLVLLDVVGEPHPTGRSMSTDFNLTMAG